MTHGHPSYFNLIFQRYHPKGALSFLLKFKNTYPQTTVFGIKKRNWGDTGNLKHGK